MLLYHFAWWFSVFWVGVFCFAGGFVAGGARERWLLKREASHLREVLEAARRPRNGQKASHRSPGSRARISSADMSRSTTPFQSETSRERSTVSIPIQGKVDKPAQPQ